MLIVLAVTGLDMVVRDESGNILDTTATSTTQLYEHHIYALDRIRKASVISECIDKNRFWLLLLQEKVDE